MRGRLLSGLIAAWLGTVLAIPAGAATPPNYEREIAPLLKRHCVKCHGPAKHEGKLDLSLPGAVARGGKQGPVLVPHDVDASLLWQRVESDEMPPEMPLSTEEKAVLKAWIIAGAPGLPAKGTGDSAASHWAFQPLTIVPVPAVRNGNALQNPIDAFIQARLETAGLSLSAPADRYALLRRVTYDLTGLPPAPTEIDSFTTDAPPDAVSRIIDRHLASPQYGERMGKIWLDAAGYADSNGYFNADSDRPLAYRYRDWVIRAFNRDVPYDQFVRSQIAGDELANFVPDQDATPETIELLEATHYLRNGQDGSGESDGNTDEVRIDRYSVLEATMQNMSASLLGLTVQCAKCHDHKFEPITQKDYYSFQSVLGGVYAPEQWLKPNERIVYASLPGERSAWQARLSELDQQIARQQAELTAWTKANRPRGQVLLHDPFEDIKVSVPLWSNTAPGDAAPGGKIPVQINQGTAPGTLVQDGRLRIIEGGTEGSSLLSTKQAFDWTPDAEGGVIQATFDLIDNRLTPDGTPAIRVGFFVALRDFNDTTDVKAGNVLIDGNPETSSSVHLDYPGTDSSVPGAIGTTPYQPGHNYGVRITNQGDGKYLLQHLCDGLPEEKTVTLTAADLPDGGFGYEYYGGRSLIIDNVLIEAFTPPAGTEVLATFQKDLDAQKNPLDEARHARETLAQNRPGKIAVATDIAAIPPPRPLLVRGNYAEAGPVAEPAPIQVLIDADAPFEIPARVEGARTSGRRLAWANWVTRPGSRAASLLARVHVNRLWQHHFGTGLVTTPENLGISGSSPSHPELLNWLAAELVRSNWSTKSIQRLILNSATYQQSSTATAAQLAADSDGRLLSRFPVRRLDAEAIRDAMLAVSGDLNPAQGGPYVASTRQPDGEVVIPGTDANSNRRSVYLQQRRTQVVSLLQVFDAPSIVFNNTRRSRSTMPLQSLSLLNSEFALLRAQHLADRLMREYPSEPERLTAALLLTAGHPADPETAAVLTEFLDTQLKEYGGQPDSRRQAWVDLCQMLLAGNAFLYMD